MLALAQILWLGHLGTELATVHIQELSLAALLLLLACRRVKVIFLRDPPTGQGSWTGQARDVSHFPLTQRTRENVPPPPAASGIWELVAHIRLISSGAN